MSFSAIQAPDEAWPRPRHVVVTEDTLSVDLEDGRTISVPVEWYPRLAHATLEERQRWELGAAGIHWQEIDEDISVRGLLLGRKSSESKKSFQRWLAHRAKGEKPWLEPGYKMGD